MDELLGILQDEIFARRMERSQHPHDPPLPSSAELREALQKLESRDIHFSNRAVVRAMYSIIDQVVGEKIDTAVSRYAATAASSQQQTHPSTEKFLNETSHSLWTENEGVLKGEVARMLANASLPPPEGHYNMHRQESANTRTHNDAAAAVDAARSARSTIDSPARPSNNISTDRNQQQQQRMTEAQTENVEVAELLQMAEVDDEAEDVEADEEALLDDDQQHQQVQHQTMRQRSVTSAEELLDESVAEALDRQSSANRQGTLSSIASTGQQQRSFKSPPFPAAPPSVATSYSLPFSTISPSHQQRQLQLQQQHHQMVRQEEAEHQHNNNMTQQSSAPNLLLRMMPHPPSELPPRQQHQSMMMLQPQMLLEQQQQQMMYDHSLPSAPQGDVLVMSEGDGVINLDDPELWGIDGDGEELAVAGFRDVRTALFAIAGAHSKERRASKPQQQQGVATTAVATAEAKSTVALPELPQQREDNTPLSRTGGGGGFHPTSSLGDAFALLGDDEAEGKASSAGGSDVSLSIPRESCLATPLAVEVHNKQTTPFQTQTSQTSSSKPSSRQQPTRPPNAPGSTSNPLSPHRAVPPPSPPQPVPPTSAGSQGHQTRIASSPQSATQQLLTTSGSIGYSEEETTTGTTTSLAATRRTLETAEVASSPAASRQQAIPSPHDRLDDESASTIVDEEPSSSSSSSSSCDLITSSTSSVAFPTDWETDGEEGSKRCGMYGGEGTDDTAGSLTTLFSVLQCVPAEDVMAFERWQSIVMRLVGCLCARGEKSANLSAVDEGIAEDDDDQGDIELQREHDDAALVHLAQLFAAAGSEQTAVIFAHLADHVVSLGQEDESLGAKTTILWRMAIELPDHWLCFDQATETRLIGCIVSVLWHHLRAMGVVDPYATWAEAWLRNMHAASAFLRWLQPSNRSNSATQRGGGSRPSSASGDPSSVLRFLVKECERSTHAMSLLLLFPEYVVSSVLKVATPTVNERPKGIFPQQQTSAVALPTPPSSLNQQHTQQYASFISAAMRRYLGVHMYPTASEGGEDGGDEIAIRVSPPITDKIMLVMTYSCAKSRRITLASDVVELLPKEVPKDEMSSSLMTDVPNDQSSNSLNPIVFIVKAFSQSSALVLFELSKLCALAPSTILTLIGTCRELLEELKREGGAVFGSSYREVPQDHTTVSILEWARRVDSMISSEESTRVGAASKMTSRWKELSQTSQSMNATLPSRGEAYAHVEALLRCSLSLFAPVAGCAQESLLPQLICLSVRGLASRFASETNSSELLLGNSSSYSLSAADRSLVEVPPSTVDVWRELDTMHQLGSLTLAMYSPNVSSFAVSHRVLAAEPLLVDDPLSRSRALFEWARDLLLTALETSACGVDAGECILQPLSVACNGLVVLWSGIASASERHLPLPILLPTLADGSEMIELCSTSLVTSHPPITSPPTITTFFPRCVPATPSTADVNPVVRRVTASLVSLGSVSAVTPGSWSLAMKELALLSGSTTGGEFAANTIFSLQALAFQQWLRGTSITVRAREDSALGGASYSTAVSAVQDPALRAHIVAVAAALAKYVCHIGAVRLIVPAHGGASDPETRLRRSIETVLALIADECGWLGAKDKPTAAASSNSSGKDPKASPSSSSSPTCVADLWFPALLYLLLGRDDEALVELVQLVRAAHHSNQQQQQQPGTTQASSESSSSTHRLDESSSPIPNASRDTEDPLVEAVRLSFQLYSPSILDIPVLEQTRQRNDFANRFAEELRKTSPEAFGALNRFGIAPKYLLVRCASTACHLNTFAFCEVITVLLCGMMCPHATASLSMSAVHHRTGVVGPENLIIGVYCRGLQDSVSSDHFWRFGLGAPNSRLSTTCGELRGVRAPVSFPAATQLVLVKPFRTDAKVHTLLGPMTEM